MRLAEESCHQLTKVGFVDRAEFDSCLEMKKMRARSWCEMRSLVVNSSCELKGGGRRDSQGESPTKLCGIRSLKVQGGVPLKLGAG